MENSKKELGNKQKHCKNDLVKQAVYSYLKKRNYPLKRYRNITLQEFQVEKLVQCEVSRPNSILYSCCNGDPIIDQSFIKFVNWLKELHKRNGDNSDLEALIGPLFCHLYFEILRGNNVERASTFFTNYKYVIDKYNTSAAVTELVNGIASSSTNLSKLKVKFRSHKFSVSLSTSSVYSLKKFLCDSAHVVLLHILQNYICINETDDNHEKKKDFFNDLCTNFVEKEETCQNEKKNNLEEAIWTLNQDQTPTFVTNLQNVKDDITCGLLKRKLELVLFCYNNKIMVRSLVSGKQLDKTLSVEDIALLGHNKRIYSLAFIDELKNVLSASEDKTIRLFDLNDYSQKNVYKGHEYPVYCLDSFKNAGYFISGSYDHTARLWHLERTCTIKVFAGHTQAITCLNTHSNCTYFATGSADRNLRLWSLGDYMPIRLFVGSKGAIFSTIFNNQANYLISAGDDKKIRIWDLVACKELIQLDTKCELVTHLSLSNDDKTLITGTNNGLVNYWNFQEIVKTSSNAESINQFALNAKLLDIEYTFDNFGFLSYQGLC